MPKEQGMSKRQMIRERRQRQRMVSRLITIGGIVIAALAFVGLIVWPNIKPVEIVEITPVARPKADFNAAGDPNAPITITEYSDFQCPFCRKFTEDTEPQLFDTYVATGKVYFVYRTFGSYIGAESQATGEAAYCAGDQGKFWEYHDLIFANQTGENVNRYTSRRLDAFAKFLGLDMNAFDSCVKSNKYADRVFQDGKDGVAAGITATPTFIITYAVNGETKTRRIEGAQGFDAFQSEIEGALAEMGLQ